MRWSDQGKAARLGQSYVVSRGGEIASQRWRLEPHDELVSANYAYCLADIGHTYVVYTEESNAITLTLGGTAAGPVQLPPPDTQEWIFVVSQGSVQTGSFSPIANSASHASAETITGNQTAPLGRDGSGD